MKPPNIIWRKLHALVGAIGRHRSSHKPTRSATTILPVHWADPADLTEEDPCRSANDPAVWIGDCCHTVGIWTMCPGTAVPEETWAGALLHATKARLMANLLSQRAVPLHRTLRGHVSPKMPDAFWLSRSAVQGDVLPGTAATDPGTWRHCLMWRITIHQLPALAHQAPRRKSGRLALCTLCCVPHGLAAGHAA